MLRIGSLSVLKSVWIQFGRVFPSLSFSVPLSSLISSSFIAAAPHFRLPFIPLFSGSGSPSWDFNCYIVGNREISRLPRRFWEMRNYRDSVKSCFRSLGDGYRLGMLLVGVLLWLVLIFGWLIFVEGLFPVFCSYRSAEVIHLGVGTMA